MSAPQRLLFGSFFQDYLRRPRREGRVPHNMASTGFFPLFYLFVSLLYCLSTFPAVRISNKFSFFRIINIGAVFVFCLFVLIHTGSKVPLWEPVIKQVSIGLFGFSESLNKFKLIRRCLRIRGL